MTYQLQAPPVREILFQPSVSAQIKIAKDGHSLGPWGSFAYAYKPMNQLLLGSSAYGDAQVPANGTSGTVIPATLYPRLAYHHLTSLEAGLETEWTAFWVSFLDERPIVPAADPQWTVVQRVENASSVSASLEWKLGKWFNDQARVGISYLRRWGGNAPDGGDFSSSSSFFENRYPFQHAVSVGLRSPMWGDLLGLSSRLIYDFDLGGASISADLNFTPRAAWRLALGADLIGSSMSQSNAAFGEDFFSRYRGNNRVRAGVSYVF